MTMLAGRPADAAGHSGVAAGPGLGAAGPVLASLAGRAGLVLLPWAAIVGLWAAAAGSGLFDPVLLPAPSAVLAQAVQQLGDGRLPAAVAASTGRVLAGLVLGVALAVPAGILLGRSRGVRRVAGPLLGFFRALPPIALIPLVIVYFGIGESAKVIVLTFAAFFAAVIVVSEGVAQIPPLYENAARTLGATRAEVFRRVVLPQALPHILTGIRVALGTTWATLVAAELVAAQVGLGATIQVAAAFFDLPVIYLGIIGIGATALAMDAGLRRLNARLLSWQDRRPA
ncbi:ABC transporter permease [uncultured Methylobacterium sp.]|jgi:NitT/TauT family transport system permease protein|uniref:ABC transporter permease n=1 Tax=uncultured Methylobacterium sp. TaxID=157278 RepID=UPI00260B83B7|nr:ABC transporter permease [uncultured Methylobacterium sp.]